MGLAWRLRSRRRVDILTWYFEIPPRWWLSRREQVCCSEIAAGYFSRRDSLKSHRDHGYLAEISSVGEPSLSGTLMFASAELKLCTAVVLSDELVVISFFSK